MPSGCNNILVHLTWLDLTVEMYRLKKNNVNKLVRLKGFDYMKKWVVEDESTRIPYPNTIGQRGDSRVVTRECGRWSKKGQRGQLGYSWRRTSGYIYMFIWIHLIEYCTSEYIYYYPSIHLLQYYIFGLRRVYNGNCGEVSGRLWNRILHGNPIKVH